MKKPTAKLFTALIAVILLLACTACDWSGMNAKVEVARTTWSMVKAGEPIGFSALGLMHAAGALPENVWSAAVAFDAKYQLLKPRVEFAFEEYDRLKDKETGEALLQLVRDINLIVEQINGIITEWKAPTQKIKTFTPLLRELPADVRRKYLI